MKASPKRRTSTRQGGPNGGRSRGDIGSVTQSQESIKSEMLKSLDTKIDELKNNICEEVTETRADYTRTCIT